jgi:hypothetical protein
MKKPTVHACLMLVAASLVARADDNPAAPFDARRLNRELPGTWECVSLVNAPQQISHIKHVTPTHYTWVTYHRDRHAILAVAGGTWSLKDGHFVAVCEFASDTHQHLRGKTNAFTINLVGDKWDHKGSLDTGFEIDEVWARMKPEERQKKNTGVPGGQLLGTWDKVFGPGAPKAIRTLKYITPTHWTWVTYDRENKRVQAAAGGTWSLRDGEYVEDCEFTTNNVLQARGKASPFKIHIDGDRWTLKGGTNRAIRDDETWTRLRKPNP